MESEDPPLPIFPWELFGETNFNAAELQSEHQQELERLGWSPADGEWVAHLASGWLCNPIERVFFHAEKGLLVPADAAHPSQVATEGDVLMEPGGESSEGAQLPSGLEQSSGDCEAESSESDEESDLMLDLEDDLEAATAQIKGSAEGKESCEDRFVTRAGLPLGVVAGSTEGLCYFTAIYDGHAGSDCADYAAAHLHKNLLSSYRQLYGTVQRKRQEGLLKQNGKKRRQPQASQWLQQLSQSSDPLRPEERRLSVEMEALVRGCFSAFSITDKNYLGLSENSLAQDAGSTACVAIFFGPDEQGALQLITAHAGDSRAVLCRNGEAMRLTEDHKPNCPSEQKRIEAAGGQVASVHGVWRVLAADARGGRTVGLSTSRALGDLAWKRPKPLVISNPTVHVYTLQFEQDAFLVLASDGVFEVLSDEDVVGLILSRLPPTPLEAAQLVIDEAVARGGSDDKTCTVIYFKWRKDLFAPNVGEAEASSSEPLQRENQHGDQAEASSSESKVVQDERDEDDRAVQTARSEGKAESEGKVRIQRDKGESRHSSAADSANGEAHQDASPIDDEEWVKPSSEGLTMNPEGIGCPKPEQESSGPAEAVADESSKRVRNSGLEEIAGITSSLDVEAIIRKRRREQKLEEEAAAAAAAAAAEAAEDDFDIFGTAAVPESPAPAAVPYESDSD